MKNRFSKKPLLLIACVAVLSGLSAQAFNDKFPRRPEAVPHELIVKLYRQPGILPSQPLLAYLKDVLGQDVAQSAVPFRTDPSLSKVILKKGTDVAMAIEKLKGDHVIEYAEPNFIYRSFAPSIPNDSDFGKLWGMLNTGQADSAGQIGKAGADIKVTQLWQRGITGNRKVVVAVIDTGVQWDHPDLIENVYTNSGESGSLASNGKDDDGNGFADDVHGWNFADGNNQSSDNHSHGSHCAGTIGAMGNNEKGVAGVNWQVRILPVKFLDASGGGTLAGAIESINYATKMKVNIMSNSWGGGGYSQGLKDAITSARNAGILFVAAAGNESNNNDAAPTYPAAYDVDNVIAVAATDNQDKLASFSNFGRKSVHVAAPGVKIYSTVMGGGYESYSGTSMATPHVAGISALLWSEHPEWGYAEIKSRLIRTSAPVPSLRKAVLAKGRVDAYAAFYDIVPPSTEPDPSLWVDVPKLVESEHPYADGKIVSFDISSPGAKYIRVFFENVDVEPRYDHVLVVNPATAETVDDITGKVDNYLSEYVQGDRLEIRLTTDSSVSGYGFKVTKIQVIR